jgi:hypothetical protein
MVDSTTGAVLHQAYAFRKVWFLRVYTPVTLATVRHLKRSGHYHNLAVERARAVNPPPPNRDHH